MSRFLFGVVVAVLLYVPLFCIDDGYSLRYVRCLRCCPLTFPCWCSIVLYRQWLRCALCSVLCFRCRLLCLGCPTCLVGTMAMVRAMSYVFACGVVLFRYCVRFFI